MHLRSNFINQKVCKNINQKVCKKKYLSPGITLGSPNCDPYDSFSTPLWTKGVHMWYSPVHICVCLHVCVRVPMCMIKTFSFCAQVSFLVTTRDREFIFGLCLHLEKTNRKQWTVSDDDPFLLCFSMNYRDFSVKSKLIISLFQTVKLSL